MNPLTNMKNVIKLSEQELFTKNKTSWHDQYRDSAWVFIGGLPYDLTEGDIICIFSQYGEIVNINLIRDKDSGKSKGFCFLCYEDQRSTDLAVDNFNGIKILMRTVRVDHVNNYRIPKQGKKTDEETKKLYNEGCAPKAQPIQMPIQVQPKVEDFDYRETLADQISSEIKLPGRLPIDPIKLEPVEEVKVKKEKKKKHKKDKKRKKSKKKKKSTDADSSDESDKEKRKKGKKRRQSSDDSADNSSIEDERKKHKTGDKEKSFNIKKEHNGSPLSDTRKRNSPSPSRRSK